LIGEIRNILSFICHQNPERSFFLGDFQFFLCARCTGIYFFLLLFLTFNPASKFNFSYKTLFAILIFSLLANLVSLMESFDTNMSRFILGSIIGIPSGLIMRKSLQIIFSKGEVR